MGFGTKEYLRRFEVKYFGISHVGESVDETHIEMLVPNPSTGQMVKKYVERHGFVEGRVIDAEWYSREDKTGKLYRGYTLTMDVGDELIHMDFPIPFKKPPSSVFQMLVHHGDNVDWTKELKISAWETKTDDGKPKTGICFWQKDANGKEFVVKSAHTKDNPNGMPQPLVDEDDGTLNWKPVERWLIQNFDNVVIPRIKAAAASYTPNHAAKKSAPIVVVDEDESGDAYPVPEFAGDPKKATEKNEDDPYSDSIPF